jgi:CRISPR-associated protein Csx10
VPILKISITARAPLVFSERRPDGQFRPSTPYVPSVALRGALAQQFIDGDNHQNDDFDKLFTALNAPLFRNAYLTYFDQTNPPGTFLPSRPLPVTAYSCKAESGFDKHDVYDSLIDRLCCEQLGVVVPYLPRCCHKDHEREGEQGRTNRVEAFVGFYVNTPQNKRSVTVPSQLTTRVALNRRRKVAQEGLLYSPLVISEATADGAPTTFHGTVVVNDDNRELVERCLPTLTHIGSGAARGFGRIEVNVEHASDEDLPKRVNQFNDRIAQRWDLWKQLPRYENKEPAHAPENGTFFAVLLMSDAILRADGWTPTVRLEEAMLGSASEGAELVRCYATADYRGGWNTAWGLPKDTELVARMGSVYVYHTPKKLDDQSWLNALRELEERGVGERRVEGFGQVRVCDEFHQDIQEVETT